MKRLTIFAALIIAAVVIFQLAYPSATVRYRLTLEADVPALVRFDDPRDPSTAKSVDASSFGLGATLRSASVEIVDAGYWPLTIIGVTGVPVTREIARKLPWAMNESNRLVFWRALYSSGFRPNGSEEIKMLLTRP
jgi:hypothetical protein